MRHHENQPSDADEAAEEPTIEADDESEDASATAMPHEKGGRRHDRESTISAEDLGRFALEQATETGSQDFEDSEPCPEQLQHRPDDSFPDRVDWPEEDLDDEL